jgi:hypothetical protein
MPYPLALCPVIYARLYIPDVIQNCTIYDHCCPKQGRLVRSGVENKAVVARECGFPG